MLVGDAVAAIVPVAEEGVVLAEEVGAPLLSRVGAWAAATAKNLIRNPFAVPAVIGAYGVGKTVQKVETTVQTKTSAAKAGAWIVAILVVGTVLVAVFLRIRRGR